MKPTVAAALAVAIAILGLGGVTSKRIKDSIYTNLQDSAFCFRRTNGTHQMGCSADFKGNVGVVHLISSPDDVSWLIQSGPHDPYVGECLENRRSYDSRNNKLSFFCSFSVIVVPLMFTHKNLRSLADSGKVSGVLLLSINQTDPSDRPERYSDDNACPNSISGLYQHPDDKACDPQENPWNPAGQNLLLEDWPFPIFFVTDEDKVNFLVEDCYERFNNKQPRDWPLCAVELQSHMFSAVDTATCQRRNSLVNPFSPTRICDPMGDKNVFYLLNEEFVDFAKDRFQDDSVLVLSARLDASDIFDKAEVGLDSPTAGIVTLLAVANLLAREHTSNVEQGKNVLFAFLHGESFDYIGSSRMVYDMEENTFPMKRTSMKQEAASETTQAISPVWPLIDLNSLSGYIELGQLFNHKSDNTVFVHAHSNSDYQGVISGLNAEASRTGLELNQASSNQGLPPASLQRVLKRRERLPGVILTNFDQSYENPYFHSVWDNGTYLNPKYNYNDPENALVTHLAKVAETVAGYVSRQVATNGRGQRFTANKTMINEMIHCFVETAKCSLFQAISGPDIFVNKNSPDIPLQQYVGVDRGSSHHGILTRRLLAYLTADILDEDEYRRDNCTTPGNQHIFEYMFMKTETPPSWFNGTKDECHEDPDCGRCVNTTTWRSEAISPGNKTSFSHV